MIIHVYTSFNTRNFINNRACRAMVKKYAINLLTLDEFKEMVDSVSFKFWICEHTIYFFFIIYQRLRVAFIGIHIHGYAVRVLKGISMEIQSRFWHGNTIRILACISKKDTVFMFYYIFNSRWNSISQPLFHFWKLSGKQIIIISLHKHSNAFSKHYRPTKLCAHWYHQTRRRLIWFPLSAKAQISIEIQVNTCASFRFMCQFSSICYQMFHQDLNWLKCFVPYWSKQNSHSSTAHLTNYLLQHKMMTSSRIWPRNVTGDHMFSIQRSLCLRTVKRMQTELNDTRASRRDCSYWTAHVVIEILDS